jgi:hypothetical protein
VIGTTIAGTIIILTMDNFFRQGIKLKKREAFTQRRQTRRRNPIRLGKRT